MKQAAQLSERTVLAKDDPNSYGSPEGWKRMHLDPVAIRLRTGPKASVVKAETVYSFEEK